MTAILVEAVKEMDVENNELKKSQEQMKLENDELKKLINRIYARLDQLEGFGGTDK